MGAPAYQVTNLETCSPRQVALLVLGFFGLWATLYGLGASAPPLYVSQCSSSTRCADGVDGANLFSTGATPLYVSDPALCANKSACTRETCYLDRDGTLDGTTVALAEQRESLGAAPTRAPPWSALPPAAMYGMYASLALVVAMLVVKAVGNASRLCASSRAAVAAALGVAAAAAAAASLAFGSAGLLLPTLPGALAAVGGCELYALLHAYVYLPVSWVGRDDGHDEDDDEL